MPAPFFMRWLAFSLAVMLCASCGASRDTKTWTVDVTMTIQLDEGFMAQQAGVLNHLQTVHDDLEWKYNKGEVITRNVAGAVVVVAVVAGIVVLMAATNSSSSGIGGGSSSKEVEPIHFIIADKTCTTIYCERYLKPGNSTIAFKAPPGEEVYLFSAMRDIRYALNKLDTPMTGGGLTADLRLVTSTLTVK